MWRYYAKLHWSFAAISLEVLYYQYVLSLHYRMLLSEGGRDTGEWTPTLVRWCDVLSVCFCGSHDGLWRACKLAKVCVRVCRCLLIHVCVSECVCVDISLCKTIPVWAVVHILLLFRLTFLFCFPCLFRPLVPLSLSIWWNFCKSSGQVPQHSPNRGDLFCIVRINREHIPFIPRRGGFSTRRACAEFVCF